MSHSVLNIYFGLIDLIEKIVYFSDFDFSTLIYIDANLREFFDMRNSNYNLIFQLVSSRINALRVSEESQLCASKPRVPSTRIITPS